MAPGTLSWPIVAYGMTPSQAGLKSVMTGTHQRVFDISFACFPKQQQGAANEQEEMRSLTAVPEAPITAKVTDSR